MPGALHFTFATDADGVRKEFVEDIKARAQAATERSKTRGGAEIEKKAYALLAQELGEISDFWEKIRLGDPSAGEAAKPVAAVRAA
jgi:hypothetical protein